MSENSQEFLKISKLVSFIVLVMCKEHVTILKIDICPSQVYLSLGIIQKFSKTWKKVEKKSHQIFPKKKSNR